MSWKRIYAIFIRQVFLFRRNPTRFVSHFLWVVMDIVLWGFISKYLSGLGLATFDFVAVILGAIVLWEFLSRLQTGVMMAFLEDIWSQNFLNLFASPLKIKEYLAGLVLTSIASSFLGLGLMVGIAGAAFGYNIFKFGLLLFPAVAILFIFGLAIGIFITAMIFRLGPSAEWLGWPISFVMSIFAGVFYPISTLPPLFQAVAKLIPASYVFEVLRSVVSTGRLATQNISDLIIAFVLSLAYLVFMYFVFLRVYRRNLIIGSLARFNAEDF